VKIRAHSFRPATRPALIIPIVLAITLITALCSSSPASADDGPGAGPDYSGAGFLVVPSTPAQDPFVTTVPAGLGTCVNLRLSVGLTSGQPTDSILAGTLCTPSAWAGGPRTVDVLVHGAMYNRRYWDWPVQPEQYSYVRRDLAAGRAAFFYDRFGAGASSLVFGPDLTFAADTYGLHEVVAWAHSKFDQVDVVAHSLGSAVAAQEAGLFPHDPDRLVLTGLTHGHGLAFLLLPASIWTATLDPQFASMYSLLDGLYMTTIPGRRAGMFYSADADKSVIAYDEAHKDVMTTAEAAGAILQLTLIPPLNVSDLITAPVLMIDGRQDAAFCGVDVDCRTDAALRAHEAPYFAGSSGFTAETVPDTGHDLALHPSAGTSFAMISSWITSTPAAS
jgi:pimeloyl-ACP methyl ester carboxylesterase